MADRDPKRQPANSRAAGSSGAESRPSAGAGEGPGAVDPDEAVEVALGDVLDLHVFRPRDVPDLVKDYLDECLERGYDRVRIIHGKGVGNLRRTVHAILERHDAVEDYSLADESAGGWGATLVRLRSR